MKKLNFLISLVMLAVFILSSPNAFAKKNQRKIFVDASEFNAYFPKDGAREATFYRYNENRQLIIVISAKSDSLITISYDVGKKEKKLSLKRDPKDPSVFYLVSPKISQKKFDGEIKKVRSILFGVF